MCGTTTIRRHDGALAAHEGHERADADGLGRFGLPAENAAIDNNVPPAQWTRANIADMKAQMRPLGLAIDWSRELATCDPDYYKWNQWFFLRMLERGIAYKKTQIVNWTRWTRPCWPTSRSRTAALAPAARWSRSARSGATTSRSRSTPTSCWPGVTDPSHPDYLAGWPERVRLMQEHWIGKSSGVRFAFTHDIRDASGTLIQDGRCTSSRRAPTPSRA